MKKFNSITLNKVLKNGGLTLNNKGITAEFKAGYQVSIKDCYILELNNTDEIIKAINQLIKKACKGYFIGLWIDNNKIYIDYSINIRSKKLALKIASVKNQLSIFSWYNQDCIYTS